MERARIASALAEALEITRKGTRGPARVIWEPTIPPDAIDELEDVLSKQSELSAFNNQRPWFLGIVGGAVTFRDLAIWLISRAFRTYPEEGNRAIEKSIDELEQFLSATEIPLMTITALLGIEVD